MTHSSLRGRLIAVFAFGLLCPNACGPDIFDDASAGHEAGTDDGDPDASNDGGDNGEGCVGWADKVSSCGGDGAGILAECEQSREQIPEPCIGAYDAIYSCLGKLPGCEIDLSSVCEAEINAYVDCLNEPGGGP